MPLKADLAKIHIAKKELKLTDDEYRSVLSGFGVDSSRSLSDGQAQEVISTFIRLGWKPRRAASGKLKYEHLAGRGRGFAKPAQLRKIEAIWREIARDKSDSALAIFVERQTAKINGVGIRRLEWLKDDHVHSVLSALQRMQKDFHAQTPEA